MASSFPVFFKLILAFTELNDLLLYLCVCVCGIGACGTGRCVNMAGGFDCLCPLGKSGMNCEKEIVIYEPSFTEGSFIAYPTPHKNALRK